MAQPEPDTPRPRPEIEEVGLKMVLWVAQAVFMDRNTYPERVYDHALNITGKKIIRASEQSENAHMRQNLGENPEIWEDFAELIEMALPVLESQSVAPEEPTTNATDSSSASLIATNYTSLTKDLERLDDLLRIGRNILASTPLAQNLAGDSEAEQQVLKLIDICIKVTTRGYDGEAGARITEAQWTKISAACKLFFQKEILLNSSNVRISRQETPSDQPAISPQLCPAEREKKISSLVGLLRQLTNNQYWLLWKSRPS